MSSNPVKYFDWSGLIHHDFLYYSGCWDKCGGYCCLTRHKDFSFQLLAHEDKAVVFYFGKEYDYWCEQGLRPENELKAPAPTQFLFDFGGPAPLRIVFVTCTLKGQCSGLKCKPIHCKLYPHIPVLGDDGSLMDILDGSVFDLTRAVMGLPDVCILVSERNKIRRLWSEHPELLKPLNNPYYQFYSQAASIFAEAFAKGLRESPVLTTLCGKEFWMAWEILYLSHKLIEKDHLKKKIMNIYARLCKKFGTDWFDEPVERQDI